MLRLMLLATLAAPLPAFAQTTNNPTDVAEPGSPTDIPSSLTISGAVTLASQYRFRGVSLSDEDIALQGTLNLSHASGFYAGVWSSTIDGFGERGGSNFEVDLYAGYRTPVSSGVTLDAGLLYYAYPGSKGGDFEFFEPYVSLFGTLGPGTAKVGVAYAWDQDALGGDSNVYAFGDLSAGLPNTPVTLKAHLGFSKGDTRLTPGGDYFDWLVGADFTRRNFTLGVAYVDTDLTGDQARRDGGTRKIVDAAIVLSLTAAF